MVSDAHISLPGHGRSRSNDTVAESTISGLADSTMSFSAFPNPPSSIPTTSSARSDYTLTPPTTPRALPRPKPTKPLTPRRKMIKSPQQLPTNAVPSQSNHKDSPPVYTRDAPSIASSSGSQVPSPFDWADGASSIDVDPTESRLLSTSFITSLLQERSPRRYEQSLTGSDALSGISEITYPPLLRPVYPPPNSMPRPSSSRPVGGRPPPPSAFSAIAPMSTSGRLSTRTTESESSTLFDAPAVRAALARGVSPGAVAAAASLDHRPTPDQVESPRSPPPPSSHTVDEYNSPAGRASPAVSTSRTPSRHFRNSSFRDRQSVYSSKGSFISRISKALKKQKPLPPVPFLPHLMSMNDEMAYRRADEARPLPQLIQRAGALSDALEHMPEKDYEYHGYQSHHSLSTITDSHSAPLKSGMNFDHNDFHASHRPLSSNLTFTTQQTDQFARDRRTRQYVGSDAPFAAPQYSPKIRHQAMFQSRKTKRITVAAICVAFAIVLAVGLGVGLSTKKKKSTSYTVPTCPGNSTGAACDLDTTCVCTSSTSCGELAQSLVTLTPIVNHFFSSNYTNKNIADAIWLLQGSPVESCTKQALIVDVGPTLDVSKYPNRTQFVRSAMLWNTIVSQDDAALKTMQTFTSSASWNKLEADGPSTTSTEFTLSVSGLIFDFAAQTISQPTVSFITQSQASSSQISRVNDQAKTGLDRMYSFALSSSTQQAVAFKTYWRTVLQQSVTDLPIFLAAIQRAQVIIPFDSTATWASDILNKSASSVIPASCYPGLNSSYTKIVNTVEPSVFNLPPLGSQTTFDSNCVPARPIYGVLDVLRLRLPFAGQTAMPRQGIALISDVNSRTVIRQGEIMSALLETPPPMDALSTMNLNPRIYGTLKDLNHVMHSYFLAIPDVNVAIAFAKYVLDSQQGLPPSENETLGQSLDLLPTIEVAIFGAVTSSDVDHTASSFASPSGSLYFGSAAADLWRNWTITTFGSSVVWAESATSPQVVRDTTLTDADFNSVWQASSLSIQNNVSGVGVSNVTQSLRYYNKFSN